MPEGCPPSIQGTSFTGSLQVVTKIGYNSTDSIVTQTLVVLTFKRGQLISVSDPVVEDVTEELLKRVEDPGIVWTSQSPDGVYSRELGQNNDGTALDITI